MKVGMAMKKGMTLKLGMKGMTLIQLGGFLKDFLFNDVGSFLRISVDLDWFLSIWGALGAFGVDINGFSSIWVDLDPAGFQVDRFAVCFLL